MDSAADDSIFDSTQQRVRGWLFSILQGVVGKTPPLLHLASLKGFEKGIPQVAMAKAE